MLSRYLVQLRLSLSTLHRAFWILWGGTLINRMGMVVLPFLSIYLISVRHLQPSLVGLIVALPGIGGILASLLMSILSDHVPRKYLFAFCLAISGVFILTLPFLVSLLWLAIMVLCWSIASEAQRPLAGMLVMDLVQEDQRRQAISLLRTAINVGGTFSSAIGGVLASIAFFPLFLADAGTTLLFALLILIFLPRGSKQTMPEKVPGMHLKQILAPLRNGAFGRFWLAGLCATTVFSQQFTTFAVYLTRQGGSPLLYGSLMALSCILIAILEFPLSTALFRVPAGGMIATGCLALAVAAGLCSLITAPLWLVFPVLAFTLGEMVFAPTYDTLGAEMAPAHQRGTYMGLLWVATGLGFAIGPALGGALLQCSPLLCWGVMGSIGLLAAALAWTTPEKRPAQ
nr:MFS transporter [Ktedonosporobacter rubrisoli]